MNAKITPAIIARLFGVPDVLAFSARALARKHIFTKFYYNRKDNVALPALAYNLKITNACNLRCKMCAQWGEKGYNFSRPISMVKEVVPVEVYKRMVDEIKKLKPAIYIWGGEPFLYPGLMEVIRYIKENNILLELVTNGVRLKEKAEELVDMGLDGLMISVDGPAETHDRIRGVKGTFDNLIRGLEQVKSFKKKKKKKKPYIVFFSTIAKDNARDFHRIAGIGDEVGIDLMVIYPSWFTTEEIGAKYTEIMEKELGTTPFTWKGYVNSFSDDEIYSIRDGIRKMKSKKYSYPIMWLPNLADSEIVSYYREPGNMFGYRICTSPWVMTEIMPNGDVVPCRDYSDYVVGNIKEKSILEIFNDERYRKFRGMLKKHGGLIPICARCCGLMGY